MAQPVRVTVDLAAPAAEPYAVCVARRLWLARWARFRLAFARLGLYACFRGFQGLTLILSGVVFAAEIVFSDKALPNSRRRWLARPHENRLAIREHYCLRALCATPPFACAARPVGHRCLAFNPKTKSQAPKIPKVHYPLLQAPLPMRQTQQVQESLRQLWTTISQYPRFHDPASSSFRSSAASSIGKVKSPPATMTRSRSCDSIQPV